jgi:hypothetical protein
LAPDLAQGSTACAHPQQIVCLVAFNGKESVTLPARQNSTLSGSESKGMQRGQGHNQPVAPVSVTRLGASLATKYLIHAVEWSCIGPGKSLYAFDS